MREQDKQVYEGLTVAMHRLSAALERAEAREARQVATERQERELTALRPFQRPDRTYDRLGRQEIRALPVASFLTGIPGLAAQFGKEVPASHLVGDTVTCTCGTIVELEMQLTSCECSRFFLRVGDGRVMVAGPFEAEPVEAVA